MKKIYILAVALSLIISLTACQKTQTEKANLPAETTVATMINPEISKFDVMPAPFSQQGEGTGGDGLRNYYSKYNEKYGSIPGSLMDLVGSDLAINWINQFENGGRNKKDANVKTFLEELKVAKSTALSWAGESENGLSQNDIEIIYSGDQEKIDKNFMNEPSIFKNGKIFTPEWIYTHTMADYKAMGLTPQEISAKISYYEKIQFATDSLAALKDKIAAYAEYYDSIAAAETVAEETSAVTEETTAITEQAATTVAEETSTAVTEKTTAE